MAWLKAGVFAVVALVMAAGAVWTGVGRAEFVKHAARAPGVIRNLNAGSAHPEVAFTVAGLTLTFPQGGWLFGYNVGDEVTVLYDPENPRMTATIDNAGALWFATSFFTFMMAVFVLGAVAFIREARYAA